MNQEKIGKFIASLRKEKNLTQSILAEQLGVTDRAISNWENGKNMPDVSIYKRLCEILGISIDELINGEKTLDKNRTISTENAIINTIKKAQKEKKKMKKFIVILITILIITSIFFVTYIKLYKPKDFKFTINNLSITKSENNDLNRIVRNNNYDIYFYGIKKLELIDINNNYYDFDYLLKSNKIDIGELKTYLRKQYKNNNILRFTLKDGRTQIYQTENYAIILCDTLDGNKDIYIGTNKMLSNLNGKYCGNTYIKENCYFTKKYTVIDIQNSDNESMYNVTLQDETNFDTLKINKKYNLEIGKTYGFTFSMNKVINDDIKSIFENADLVEVNKLNKIIYKKTLDNCNDKYQENV